MIVSNDSPYAGAIMERDRTGNYGEDYEDDYYYDRKQAYYDEHEDDWKDREDDDEWY